MHWGLYSLLGCVVYLCPRTSKVPTRTVRNIGACLLLPTSSISVDWLGCLARHCQQRFDLSDNYGLFGNNSSQFLGGPATVDGLFAFWTGLT